MKENKQKTRKYNAQNNSLEISTNTIHYIELILKLIKI